jgi:hypothetical protein
MQTALSGPQESTPARMVALVDAGRWVKAWLEANESRFVAGCSEFNEVRAWVTMCLEFDLDPEMPCDAPVAVAFGVWVRGLEGMCEDWRKAVEADVEARLAHN